MATIRIESRNDVTAREALLDLTLGSARFTKVSERLREDRLPAHGLSFAATEGGRLVGTVRLWDISAGPGRPALLLGPLAVHPDHRSAGIGGALMRRALDDARRFGHRAVLLVGDAPYYSRFGFSADTTGNLWLPGRYETDRFLALELVPGVLDGARGMVSATGRMEPKPDLRVLIAAAANGNRVARLSHAA